MAVLREALVDHPAGGDLQRREQGGRPMPHIVVGAPLGAAGTQRQVGGGAGKRLDLGLLVHADHNRSFGRVQVQADHVADLGFQLRVGGELEGLGPPRFEVVLGPDAGDGVVATAQLVGEQPGGPVGDPEVLGRWRQGGGQDLGAAVASDGLGRPGRGWSASPARPRWA